MAAVLVAVLSVGAAPVQQGSANTTAATPTQAEVRRALEIVRADPNLGTERTIKMLRWRDSTETPSAMPAWVTWTAGLFRWVDQSARLLVWGAVAVLAVLLIVYVVRTVRTHGVLRGEEPFVAPTHVRDMDIRPKASPDMASPWCCGCSEHGRRSHALRGMRRGSPVHRVHIRVRHGATHGVRRSSQAGKAHDAARLVRVCSGACMAASTPAVRCTCSER